MLIVRTSNFFKSPRRNVNIHYSLPSALHSTSFANNSSPRRNYTKCLKQFPQCGSNERALLNANKLGSVRETEFPSFWSINFKLRARPRGNTKGTVMDFTVALTLRILNWSNELVMSVSEDGASTAAVNNETKRFGRRKGWHFGLLVLVNGEERSRKNVGSSRRIGRNRRRNTARNNLRRRCQLFL